MTDFDVIEQKKLTFALNKLAELLSVFERGKYSGIPISGDADHHIEKAKKHLLKHGTADHESGIDHIVYAFARLAMAISTGADVAGTYDGDISMPVRAGDAGYDVRSKNRVELVSGRITMVDIGLRLCIKPGLWYRMASRSSLTKRGCFCVDNTIDATYSGKLFVPVYNTMPHDVVLESGERFAQIIFYNTIHPSLSNGLVEIEGGRGEKGFGSSGKL